MADTSTDTRGGGLYITDRTKDILRHLPLETVMREHGYKVVRKTATHNIYICPLHKDTDASFTVQTTCAVGNTCGWKCQGCGAYGEGAITLEAALSEIDLKGKGFLEVCKNLIRMFNLVVEDENGKEVWLNGFFHRAKEIGSAVHGEGSGAEDAGDEGVDDAISPGLIGRDGFVWKEKVLEDCDVRALGCKVCQVESEYGYQSGTDRIEQGDSQVRLSGEARSSDHGQLPSEARYGDNQVWLSGDMKYSWGKNYVESWQGANFDLECVKRIFHYHAVEWFVTPRTANGKRWKVSSSQYYPIGVFEYANENGEPYWKKYEPLMKVVDADKGKATQSKFTWYFSGEKPKRLSGMLWGDHDFMEAWRTGVCNPDKSEDTEDGAHPYILEEKEREDGSTVKTWKMERLVLCSGPKDGMNVYFHSSAHVCWGMSERSTITDGMMARLRKIAKDIYILYDIDCTGIQRMNDIALKHLDLKVVRLPNDLRKITSARTHKPCKDVSEYLYYYTPKAGRDINYAFEGLLHNAVSMKFWREIGARKNVGGGRVPVVKYELLVDSISQFAAARGYYLYNPKLYNENEQIGRFFMKVTDNKVRVIEDKDMVQELKNDMKQFLQEENYQYNNQDLRNTISTSRRMSLETMQEFESDDISFIHWKKGECYFFFRNTSVRVTADGIECVPYSALPFYVNEKAIVNRDFTYKGDEFFDIVYNKEGIAKMERNHQQYLAECETDEERRIENRRYADWIRLRRYILILRRKMNDMPPAFQALYDTNRIYWRQEKQGMKLNEVEQQTQDINFIGKCLSIGYMLDPWRDPTRIFLVAATDYDQYVEGKPCGRNLKSFVGTQLMPLVRNIYTIGGKDFKSKPEKFGENFAGYELTEHSSVYIDDLGSKVDVEIFFNATGQMVSKRKLYNDMVQIKGQWVPKIMLSLNNGDMFDLSAPSVRDRVWLTTYSDYYHAEDEKGEFEAYSPMIKFGKQIITQATEEEMQETIWMLLKMCQIWMRENRDHYEHAIVRPVTDDKKKAEQLAQVIKEPAFHPWAEQFFEKEHHFGVPISIREMLIDFIRYKTVNEEGVDPREVVIQTDEVKYDKVRLFKDMIKTYCEHLSYQERIVCNPEKLFGNESDYKNENGTIRRKTWVSAERDGYIDFTRPRTLKNSERVFYFYRINAVPESKEKMRAMPVVDMDPHPM